MKVEIEREINKKWKEVWEKKEAAVAKWAAEHPNELDSAEDSEGEEIAGGKKISGDETDDEEEGWEGRRELQEREKDKLYSDAE
jgi:hypothetical protein